MNERIKNEVRSLARRSIEYMNEIDKHIKTINERTEKDYRRKAYYLKEIAVRIDWIKTSQEKLIGFKERLIAYRNITDDQETWDQIVELEHKIEEYTEC